MIQRALHDIFLCCEVQNGVHSKKILVQSSLTYVEVPVAAMFDRVNEASRWNLLTHYFKNGLAWLNVSSEGNERGQLLSIKGGGEKKRDEVSRIVTG